MTTAFATIKRLTTLALLAATLCAPAQKYRTGLLPNDEKTEKIPRKPQLLTRDFKVLPKSCSLLRYCPTPKSQGEYGTCTSWATTYAARTICEAINNGWTAREQIDNEGFAKKVAKTLAGYAAPAKDIAASTSDIRFKAETTKAIVPIIVEIAHK